MLIIYIRIQEQLNRFYLIIAYNSDKYTYVYYVIIKITNLLSVSPSIELKIDIAVTELHRIAS